MSFHITVPTRRFHCGKRLFQPSVSVVESENEILITAKLPGMTKDNIDIEYLGSRLSVHGKREESQIQGKDLFFMLFRLVGTAWVSDLQGKAKFGKKATGRSGIFEV